MTTQLLEQPEQESGVDAEEQAGLRQEEEREEMAGGEHGEIAMLLAWHLAAHVYPHKLGRLFDGQTTFRIGGKPPTRRPDLSFVTLARMPVSIKGEIPFSPDLAVEIASPTNPIEEIDLSIIQYLQAGVRLVWVIRPTLKMVEVYHPGDLKATTYGSNDDLVGEQVITGFKLPVQNLFPQ